MKKFFILSMLILLASQANIGHPKEPRTPDTQLKAQKPKSLMPALNNLLRQIEVETRLSSRQRAATFRYLKKMQKVGRKMGKSK